MMNWFKRCTGLSYAMGLDVVSMEGKCFILRGMSLETVPKKWHFAHIGASFSNLRKKL